MRVILILLFGLILIGARAQNWHCQNDLEVQCSDNSCETTPKAEFTPMDISFDNSGTTSICAYSGCWEGISDVLNTTNFLVLIGQELRFSTALETDDSNAGQSMSLSLDKNDDIAVLKLGSFAQPLHCELIDDRAGVGEN